MNLIHHPTTWLFVDDEPRFLESIKAFLPKEQLAIFFDDPREALAYLKAQDEGLYSAESGSEFDLDDAKDVVTNKDRFARVSVVIADYAMPHMTGLDMLQDVHSEFVGKILLTGVAEEDTAAAAFNQKVIDRFIKKGSADALDQILIYAEELQGKWIESYQKTAFPSAINNPFDDPSVARLLKEIFSKNAVTEWYLCSQPAGFYCLDHMGNNLFICVIDEKNLDRRREECRLAGCPSVFLSGETNYLSMLFDPVIESEDYDWSFNSVEVQRVGPNYWVGIHTDPPSDINFDSEAHSFNSYLQEVQ